MPLTAAQQAALSAAINRLQNYYDGDNPYNPATNPGGFRQGGQVVNFEPALKDTATVMQYGSVLVADAVAASTNSPKAVRVDSQQNFAAAEVLQALTNLGLLGNSYTLTADQMDQIRLFIGGGAVGQLSGTGTINLAPKDLLRRLNVTGTPTIVVPNVSSGWSTGTIKNSNTGPTAGTVSLAVPSGSTLDGVLNGTTPLYSLQRAAIIQVADKTFLTDWIEQEPIVAKFKQASSATAIGSFDLALPPGYDFFDIDCSQVRSSDGGAIGSRLSFNGGSAVDTTSNYISDYILEYDGSITADQPQTTYWRFPVWNTDVANQRTSPHISKCTFNPGTSLLSPSGIMMFGGRIATHWEAGLVGAVYLGAAARANLMRIFGVSGNIIEGLFVVRGRMAS